MQKLIYVTALAALSGLVGCMAPRTSGVMVEKGRIAIEDPAFASNIEVVSDARERTSEGFLHAQVTLKNTNRQDYSCQYRFEWRGQNGMIQKHAPSPWTPFVLNGRETVDIDVVSPLQGTEDFRLKIRRADGEGFWR